MKTAVAFLVRLSWPDGPENNNDTPEQVAAIKEAIECLCGVESVEDLLAVGDDVLYCQDSNESRQ